MDFFHLMYGGNPNQEPEPDAPRPTGLKLLAVTLWNHWWDMVKLNIYFWLLCLPIVTIPAALKAMTKVTVMFLRDENVDLWHDFWRALRERFWRTTGLGWLVTGGIAAVGFGVWFYAQLMRSNGLFVIPMGVLLMVAVILLMATFFLYPMLAFSELGAGAMLKNAVLLTLARLPHTVAALCMVLLLAVLYWIAYPYTAILLPAIGFSLTWLIVCFASWPGLTRYVFHESEE